MYPITGAFVAYGTEIVVFYLTPDPPLPQPENFRVTGKTATTLTVEWDMAHHQMFEENGRFSLRWNIRFRDKFDVAPGGGDLAPSVNLFVYRDLMPSTIYYLKIQALLNGERKVAKSSAQTLSGIHD